MFVVWLWQILTLEERSDSAGETQEERQGKMLLHTEYSLLSLLHNQDGVVHHHGLFQVNGDRHTLAIKLHFCWQMIIHIMGKKEEFLIVCGVLLSTVWASVLYS